jgi:hypothetical protein
MTSLQGMFVMYGNLQFKGLKIQSTKVDYLDVKIVQETLWKNKNIILNSFLERVYLVVISRACGYVDKVIITENLPYMWRFHADEALIWRFWLV